MAFHDTKIDHFVVHYTIVNPGHDDLYGAGQLYVSIESALARCRERLKEGCKAFITARNEDDEILEVIAVAPYPVAGSICPYSTGGGTRDDRTVPAVGRFLDDMDWTV
ncbi:hypothetical protein [Streptomyces sp. 5-10]|uniref:hypothetical protein n=1 Tax=Streptomyces sp. 5-10 TaxID=878925 RepID=UPI00168B40F9|nr:hypothetical protein [Streptomyces sp. 5-10]MBD3004628.1 hypothetical protein [Streptomyces sp. 5-10]